MASIMEPEEFLALHNSFANSKSWKASNEGDFVLPSSDQDVVEIHPEGKLAFDQHNGSSIQYPFTYGYLGYDNSGRNTSIDLPISTPENLSPLTSTFSRSVSVKSASSCATFSTASRSSSSASSASSKRSSRSMMSSSGSTRSTRARRTPTASQCAKCSAFGASNCRHHRTHSDPHVFSCSICDKTFTRAHDRNLHECLKHLSPEEGRACLKKPFDQDYKEGNSSMMGWEPDVPFAQDMQLPPIVSNYAHDIPVSSKPQYYSLPSPTLGPQYPTPISFGDVESEQPIYTPRTSHLQIEKRYRSRLNSQFETLLSALPRMPESNGEKKISKAEILVLAMEHIPALERERRDLEGENLASVSKNRSHLSTSIFSNEEERYLTPSYFDFSGGVSARDRLEEGNFPPYIGQFDESRSTTFEISGRTNIKQNANDAGRARSLKPHWSQLKTPESFEVDQTRSLNDHHVSQNRTQKYESYQLPPKDLTGSDLPSELPPLELLSSHHNYKLPPISSPSSQFLYKEPVATLHPNCFQTGFETIEDNLKHLSNDCPSPKSTPLSPMNKPSPTTPHVLGKASPYSLQSPDGESDSCEEVETDNGSDDEDGDFLSPSPPPLSTSDFVEPKRLLIVDILHAFWDFYNKDFQSIISRCRLELMARGYINERTSGTPSSSSKSAYSSSGVSRDSPSRIPNSSGKRKLRGDEPPSDDGGRGPSEPTQAVAQLAKGQSACRYACPFRKHNPRKYNMHQHQRCALGSFGSIARVKEHLYRRHMAPIQCVRCWLFFKDQETLNIHISATQICERRDGQVAEGVTSSMEKRLRSRKKSSASQTDEDRWRDIYRMLFPAVVNEDIPSPFYETVQDDAAQASESLDIPIEEFMRQEVPQFFTSRLQAEVNNMNLEETGLLDDGARLRESFISRMGNLIKEAQVAAIEAYRQKQSESNAQNNQLMTPGQSSSPGSCPALSQETSRTSHQTEDSTPSEPRLPVPSWPRNLQLPGVESKHNAVEDYLMTQTSPPVDNRNLAHAPDGSLIEGWKQRARESQHFENVTQHDFGGDWQQQMPDPDQFWQVPDDWDFTTPE